MSNADTVAFELTNLFGTTDLLSIIGIKSKEAYQKSANDLIVLRLSYLRAVIKHHPNTSGLTIDTLEGVKEAYGRTKKLFVMEDIFTFFTKNDDQIIQNYRRKYLEDEILPDLPSLKFLRDNSFKGEFPDFKVPQFEDVAAEMKSLFQVQMKRITAMQQEDLQQY